MFKLIKKNVKFFVGNNSINKLILQPFDPNVCEFLHKLSQNIISNKITRRSPDLIAASWVELKATTTGTAVHLGCQGIGI